jgi:predicted permease
VSRTGDDAPLATRLLRRLVRAYPPVFRRTFGADLVGLHRSERDRIRRERGRGAALRFDTRTVAAALAGVVVEWTHVVVGLGTLQRVRPGEGYSQDVRLATRALRATPGYAASVVLTLSIGIGAASLLHAERDSYATEAPDLPERERVVLLGERVAGCPSCLAGLPPSTLAAVRRRAPGLESVSAYEEFEPVLRADDGPDLMDAVRVDPDFFQALGAQALAGRLFDERDATPGADPVAILAERAWRVRFGDDPGIIGRTIVVDRVARTVVGVVRGGHVYPGDAELWVPLSLGGPPMAAGANVDAPRRSVLARLAAGTTPDAAGALIEGIGSALDADAAVADDEGNALWLVTLPDLQRLRGADSASVFAWSVALVLVIACVNLGGLLTARLAATRRAFAVRRALGASRARIVRQMLTETLLLSGLGGVGAVGVAVVGRRALDLGALAAPTLRTFGFALALGVLSGLAIALVPSIRAARSVGDEELRDLSRSGSDDGTGSGRRLLVVAEIALSTALLCASGALARSFLNVYAVHAGFETGGLLAVRMWSAPAPAATVASRDPSHRLDELVLAVERVPGVVRAGAALGLPFGHGAPVGDYEVVGREPLSADARPRARLQGVSPGYFGALGVPMLAGRGFDDRDGADAPRVAIVNRALAGIAFDAENPIGRSLQIDGEDWEIVGVSRTLFQGDVERPAEPVVYRPLRQWGWTRPSTWVVLRLLGDPATVADGVRVAVRGHDPDVALTRLATMDDLRAGDMAGERRALRLTVTFTAAAVLITFVGLYGVMSHAVARRTREFGVRLALGAPGARVLGLVLGQGMAVAALGGAFGIALALLLLSAMRTSLYQVTPYDPVVLTSAVAGVFLVALVAATAPARRAVRVDPLVAIRDT